MSVLRTRIFVDFWNLQLNIIERRGKDYRLDWMQLSPVIIQQAQNFMNCPLRFDGTNVYLSFNPHTPQGKGLHGWAINTLDRMPGIRVISTERKPKSAPICPTCHTTVDNCPHCHGKMLGTVEKGIDTAIVTDIISLAWEDKWDIAVLVSSDRDLVPCVEFLNNKGHRVINGHFPPDGMHLARTCWASFDLATILTLVER